MKAKIVQHKEITNIYSRQNYMNYSDWNLKLKKKSAICIFNLFENIR